MKARTTGAYVLIALGAVATAVVVFSRGTALEAIFPAERARRSFSDKVWSRVKGACRGASASAENVALRREVAALALARDGAARLEAENARLRRVLEYRDQNPETWLVAEVLAAGGALGPRRTMRVGKGSLAGVREGAVVVVVGDFLLGFLFGDNLHLHGIAATEGDFEVEDTVFDRVVEGGVEDGLDGDALDESHLDYTFTEGAVARNAHHDTTFSSL